MTENQNLTNTTSSWLDSLIAFLKSWQFKVAIAITIVISMLVGIGLLMFFWQHIIAVQGMKAWAKRSHAQPIECMIKDTNDDKYVSCSAILNDQVIPLECGASIFNIGCRVNYGAAPPVTRQPITKSR